MGCKILSSPRATRQICLDCFQHRFEIHSFRAIWSSWLLMFLQLERNLFNHQRRAFNKFPDFFVQAFKVVLLKILYVIAILLMRWLTNFYDFRLKWRATAAIGIHPTKAWLSQLMNFKNVIWTRGQFAIKLCFKLGKNTTETYGMLQTVFRPSCMNRASIFEWHKRFKEGKGSVREDERCGRSKEVRTPELIGQINNFMDKDRRVSIETISAQFDVSVGIVHTIIREKLKMRKICAKFVPRVLREDQKERCCHDSKEMVELINSDPAVLDALVTCDESWIYCYDPETKRQCSQWKHDSSPRPKKARQSKSTHKILKIPFFLTAQSWSTCTGFPLDRGSTRNTMLRF